ncbi:MULTISPECIES: class 1 fructose-bisphosphatase [unclassified Campylobacter]|uniref:class 1 fructose-bisphosphatase n=1 Tax=unclassified Campylobacter TaxID=2593542 RepID=UPI00123811AF|nr:MULTISPECIES: class 1 fructose-bisphosphatase [unclassified Campylobacter]KAA6224998.1 class 1 fructose-bisphosphatase [Campylobacter sp. LR196d]KAA6225320.1 class 1 fructose-bisphosphatase [Campylobacter sp. LR286c]KAA6225561.1 class 1 fructose-bisphosphatase [Campylobacter sp. LR185c]KAA6230529.1 class 1 fructose-bisphosphatase [Campylobacter sp. LR264d]KAA8604849.1 fructose-bisphosphatase class I [Campylobacter sp. LR185c]
MDEIFDYIKKAVLSISNELKFPDTSYNQSQNKTGDTQLKFDVISDEIITNTLSKCPNIKALISEEKDESLILNEEATYIVAYDPLDGSSLMDVNFAIGSIFAIYEKKAQAKCLKAAIYSIYGPRLELVICKDCVNLYRLNKENEFIFVKKLIMQEKGKINATGGTQKNWDEKHAKFIKGLFDEGYRLRYSGAMVSDMHQILCKGGGLFSYPATKNSVNGKLRAFFEVFPFAYITEKAGGKTSNGLNESLLDLEFDNIHATTPCFFGSKYEINALLKAYNER